MAPYPAAFDFATPLWSQHLALLIFKATLILLAAFGLSVVLQRASAGTRHLVWLVALGTILVAPLLIAWSPLDIRVLPAADVATAATATATRAGTGVPSVDIPQRAHAATVAESAPGPSGQPVPAPPSVRMWQAIIASAGHGLLVIGALWAIGVLLVLGGLGWSLYVVRRIVRDARPLDDPEWRTLLVEVADRLGLNETPRLVVARETHMPFGIRGVHAYHRATRGLQYLESRPTARRLTARARTHPTARLAGPHARSACLRGLLVPSARLDGSQAPAHRERARVR